MEEDKDLGQVEKPELQGAFIASLRRNNKQIRDERAQEIYDTIEMLYRRKVEDVSLKVKRYKSQLTTNMDMSPETIGSLVPAESEKTINFVERDFEIIANLTSEELLLEKVHARYEFLFGKKISL